MAVQQAEALRSHFLVRLYKRSATFQWSLSPTCRSGCLDLKVKIPTKELLSLAKEIGCFANRSRIMPSDIDAYNRLLIYAAVRPTLTSHLQSTKLAWLVKGLTGWDAHYWASRFRELWWEHRKFKGIRKTIKAFKLFFGLDEGG